MSCWSCAAEVVEGSAFCAACRKIQPVGRGEDHFSLLGLPRAFALERAALDRSFRERSRQLHPDRFARAEPRERRLSLERTTRLNDAYRCLEDWRLRGAHLLRLAGTDVFEEARTCADPGFLEEQLEWREGLALARADGDRARLARIAADARARLEQTERDVAALFEQERWYSELPREIARRLARARYYENIIADAERAGDSAGR